VDLAAAQRSCGDCSRAKCSEVLRVPEVTFQGEQLLVDTSSGVLRPLVPLQFRRLIFENIHSLAYPVIRASRSLIGSRFL
jgi:hypothetical protein